MNNGSIAQPFAHPLYVMLKPAGAQCNLACEYCYYLEKEKLYGNSRRHLMSEELLERFTRQYIEAQTQREVLFTWHGGEALLRPISFYQKAIELQRRYARGHLIDNCIQTNGTLLTDEWCDFFRRNNWLVGLSIDGPEAFHDRYRRTRNGKPTFRKVMDAVSLLNRHGVEWNAMATVNAFNGDHPLEFYHFFKEINCHYIQFTPVVERDAQGQVTDYSVTPKKWGDFLCTLFDEWVTKDVGEYFIQLFDATLANWVGVTPGLCSMSGSCGHALVMEFNGDVYSCDHFVSPRHLLGNIHEKSITEMAYSEQQNKFGAMKNGHLPDQCRKCRWLFACHGECPKNRFVSCGEGQPALNYLCDGYRHFFEHVAPHMDFMKAELEADRAPANIMSLPPGSLSL